MALKLPLRLRLHNFLQRQSAKAAARKTPRKVFAFGAPSVPIAPKNPVER
jgi:hypothetical protein